jgi:hypothetical protein
MATTTLEIDPLDVPIEGAAAFADVLRWPEKRVRYLLERKLLDADKIGPRIWVSTPRRLLKQFAGKAETAR